MKRFRATSFRPAETILAIADSDVVGLARFLRASTEVQQLFVGTPVITVANRVRSRVAGIAPHTHVRQTLERFGGLSDIVLLSHDDRAFDACSLQASPLCNAAPRSAVRSEIRELAIRCAASFGVQAPKPSSERGLFGRRHRRRMTLG